MRLTAHGSDGIVSENSFYSIGGGFVIDQAQARTGTSAVAATPLRYEFSSAQELLAICRGNSRRISEVMLDNESAWRSEDETRAALQRIWQAMRACVARGISHGGVLPGGLEVRRRAPALHAKLLQREGGRNLISDTMAALDWVNIYATRSRSTKKAPAAVAW